MQIRKATTKTQARNSRSRKHAERLAAGEQPRIDSQGRAYLLSMGDKGRREYLTGK